MIQKFFMKTKYMQTEIEPIPLNETFTKYGFFLWTIVGPTSSGKTMEMTRIVLDPKYGIRTFFKPENIYLFSKNCRMDDSQITLIDGLQEEKDLNGEPLFSDEDNIFTVPATFIKRIAQICDRAREIKKAKPNEKINTLLILDDFVGSNVDLRSKFLSQLSTDCRHLNVSVIQILHDVRKIDPMQIAQQTHMSFYYQKNYERLKTIFKDICGASHKAGLQYYQECTGTRYGYIFINFNEHESLKYNNTID